MTDTTANNSSERSVCLTIAERYAAIKHAYGLTCTTAARLLINEFVEKLQLDDEEKKTYQVSVKYGVPEGSDLTYTRCFTAADFPQQMLVYIKEYVVGLKYEVKEREAKIPGGTKGSFRESAINALSKIADLAG